MVIPTSSIVFKPRISLILFSILILSSSFAPSFADTIISATCDAIHEQDSRVAKCNYVKTNLGCEPQGYINYLHLFYCNFSQVPQLGFIVLLIWLVILFYILSNTASEFFCPSVEHLSNTLNLSPAIAGTTLLPLGNGATDVFSSVIAFTSTSDGGEIGLNSILGGSIFISCIVVGMISLLVTYRKKIVKVDKPNFIRDVVFLLVTLSNVLVIMVLGRINLWVSLLFVSTYVIYILLVSYMHFHSMKKKHKLIFDAEQAAFRAPLIGYTDEDDEEEENIVHPAEKDVDYEELEARPHNLKWYINMFLYVVKLPFYLPRRLTIPVITKDRWSKGCLVIAVVLAPITVVLIWNTKEGKLGLKASLVTYFVVGSIGVALGICTYVFARSNMPPQKGLVFWYASGFLMSVTWTYVTCSELVSLLESLGNILGMSTSIIGLTILAWGNSIGDLVANVAIAMYGGPDGTQIAISGCYAAPLFNVLIGLGVSFVFVSWSDYPASYVIPQDPYTCETIGFLMVGLLWALVILPKRDMRLDHTLGGGLLVIYLCFLFLKLARALGLLS